MENGMNHKFMTKIKEVSFKDLLHIFLFLLAIIPAKIFQMRRPHMWLLCESEMEARDNGYWLFKYICENEPDCDVVYAINPQAKDYEKVARLGNTISYGTFQHWIYYLAAEVNVSSQKGGKPNAAVCYLLEVYGIRKNIRVFLQHGIIKNDLSFVHYENAKFAMFVTSTQREYEYVRDNYNYPGNEVQLLGIARLDRLFEVMCEREASNASVDSNGNMTKKQILFMPTWRSWISPPSHGKSEFQDTEAVKGTAYYQAWNGILQDKRLWDLLEEKDAQLVFYQHRGMQKFNNLFESHHPRVRIATEDTDDVQQLLIASDYLVSDYSSVTMDFAYMNKPLSYYQFDYEEFRKRHYAEGYFSYVDDGFGPVVTTEEELFLQLQSFLRGEGELQCYKERRDDFFTLRDGNNCKRNYDTIVRLLEQGSL